MQKGSERTEVEGGFSNLGTLNFSVNLYKVNRVYKNLEALCAVQQNPTKPSPQPVKNSFLL